MKVIKVISVAVIVMVLVISILVATQPGFLLQLLQPAFGLVGPNESFSESDVMKPLDYSLPDNWAAHPHTRDAADLVPEGSMYTDNQGSTHADVFYIHGTGYLSSDRWIATLEPNTATAENTNFFLANEASIFNSCCDVYAPRYRQASFFAYIGVSSKERDRILAAVYPDVKAAFEYFISHYNNNRPFIIAGHSQGAHHALRLISEVIDGTPLAKRMVVAYTLGSTMIPLSTLYLEELKSTHACQHATDVNCLVHWDTYGRGGLAKLFGNDRTSLCTNPLTWRVDEIIAENALHLGAVPVTGRVSGLMSEDKAAGIFYNRLDAPMQNYTWAKCEEGTLYVADQSDQEYIKLGNSPDKSYHGLDFIMFHMNIRSNSLERLETFISSDNSNSKVLAE